MTVLFSISLFFGAVSGRVRDVKMQLPMVSMSVMVFVAATIITATFPIRS